MLRGVIPKILSKLNEDGHYVEEKVICQSIKEPSGNGATYRTLNTLRKWKELGKPK